MHIIHTQCHACMSTTTKHCRFRVIKQWEDYEISNILHSVRKQEAYLRYHSTGYLSRKIRINFRREHLVKMYAAGWSILLGVAAIIPTIESSSTNQNGTIFVLLW